MNFHALSGIIKSSLQEIQELALLSWKALRKISSPPFYYREFAVQMDKIGVGSLFIIILTGTFTGMVMALQFLAQLKPFPPHSSWRAEWGRPSPPSSAP